VEQLRDKFSFKLVFSPVPEAGDFRVDVGAQALAEIREQYEEALNTRVADAVRGSWDRLHKVLSAMSEKLIETDARKCWHDSFIGNAQEMCTMLTHLNVTKDPVLEQARRDLETAIMGVDIDDVKESEIVRESLKKKVDSILSGYDW
jgi:hypothetical protein